MLLLIITKRRIMKKIISIFILAIILVSCALESEFGLPNNSKTDKKLMGKWYNKDKNGVLIFDKNKDNTFSISIIDNEGKKNIISKHAYTTTINKFKIINLTDKTKDGKIINMFYGYSLSKNIFKFREVNSNGDNKKFKTKEELLAYFKANIDKHDFFNDWEEPLYKE